MIGTFFCASYASVCRRDIIPVILAIRIFQLSWGLKRWSLPYNLSHHILTPFKNYFPIEINLIQGTLSGRRWLVFLFASFSCDMLNILVFIFFEFSVVWSCNCNMHWKIFVYKLWYLLCSSSEETSSISF